MALISSQLQWLDAELESAVDECGQVVEQNNAWLAETIQKNTKNLQYQTNPSLECPRSQRKPLRRGRKKGMDAVSEEPEEKENASNGDGATERDASAASSRRLGLSARGADSSRDETSSKRKGESSESEGDAAPIGETKRVKRDQVAEIIAAADTANAAAAEAAISKLKTCEPPDFGKKRVPELRKELVALGLNDKGRKDELVERLTSHFLEQQGQPTAAAASVPAVEADEDDSGGSAEPATSAAEPESADPVAQQQGAEQTEEVPLAAEAPSSILQMLEEEEAAEEEAEEVGDQAGGAAESAAAEEAKAEPEPKAAEEAVEVEQADADTDLGASPLAAAPSVLSPLMEEIETSPSSEPEMAKVPEAAPLGRRGSIPRAARSKAAAVPSPIVESETMEEEEEEEAPAADDVPAEERLSSLAAEERGEEVVEKYEEAEEKEAGEEAGEEAAEAEQEVEHSQDEHAPSNAQAQREQSAEPAGGSGGANPGSLLGRIRDLGQRFMGNPVSTPAASSPAPVLVRVESQFVKQPGFMVADELQRKMDERRQKLGGGSTHEEPVAEPRPSDTAVTPAPATNPGPLKLGSAVREPAPFGGQHRPEAGAAPKDEAARKAGGAAAPAATAAGRARPVSKAEEERQKLTKAQEEKVSKALERKEAAEAEARRRKQEGEQQRQEGAKRRREEQEKLAREKQAEKDRREREQKAKLQEKQREEDEAKRRREEEKVVRKAQVEQRRREMAEEKAIKAQKTVDDTKPAAEPQKTQRPEPQRKPATATATTTVPASAPAPAPAPAPAAPPKPKQKAQLPPLPEGWKEYVDKSTGKSYYYNASTSTTTWERPAAASGRASSSTEVQIPTHKSSHSSQEDDESDEESGDEGGAAKRKLPSWANPKELMSQLQQQADPTQGDDVFDQRIHLMEEACALKDIFGAEVTNKRHHRRGSSGCWDLDRLTEEEEQAYLKSHQV